MDVEVAEKRASFSSAGTPTAGSTGVDSSKSAESPRDRQRLGSWHKPDSGGRSSFGMQGIVPFMKTDDVLEKAFGDVGEVIADFSCAFEGQHVHQVGRLYISTQFVCFYSNIFGHEKKIKLPYRHIRNIMKETTAKVFNSAIGIDTGKRFYRFKSFVARDEAFGILESCLKKHQDLAADGDTESLTDTESLRGHEDEDNVQEDKDMNTEAAAAGAGAGETVDYEALFNENAPKVRRKIPVVSNETLPISIDKYFELFIADDAPYGYPVYHKLAHDTILDVPKWAHNPSCGGGQRDMKFFKPVNLPGLKETRGTKTQRQKKCGSYALVVLSSTAVEDVPAADCFTIDDTVLVKAAGPDQVSVEISFEVKFIKSTMFKYMIEKGSNAEMHKWLQAYFAYLLKVSTASSAGLHEVSVATTATATATATATKIAVSEQAVVGGASTTAPLPVSSLSSGVNFGGIIGRGGGGTEGGAAAGTGSLSNPLTLAILLVLLLILGVNFLQMGHLRGEVASLKREVAAAIDLVQAAAAVATSSSQICANVAASKA